MVVNVEKLLKVVIFQHLSKNGEMLKNVGENNLKQFFAPIFFYTQDIKNIIFNSKFYQHFLPSLFITYSMQILIQNKLNFDFYFNY